MFAKISWQKKKIVEELAEIGELTINIKKVKGEE